MCTAIFDNRYGSFFGRTLDLECSYGEEVARTKKSTELSFIYEGGMDSRFAFIGMAHRVSAECGVRSADIRREAANCEANVEGVPLYYDGMNESGLCIAALNFSKCAVYNEKKDKCRNLASFEVIPFVLANCGNIDCVKKLLSGANITNDAFSEKYPPAPLHWMIADRERSIVAEQTARGLEIHENTVGVMTNPPDFVYHMTRLSDYSSLSPLPPENKLCPELELPHYSRGLGAYGLPGDYSSVSRFVRAVYVKEHTLLPSKALFNKEKESFAFDRFLHIMSSVSVPLGCILTDSDKPVCTVYTSVCDMDELTYRYFTYSDREIKTAEL